MQETAWLSQVVVDAISATDDLHMLHNDLQGGMGCSNGVIGIGLMRDLLQVRAAGRRKGGLQGSPSDGI
jgi:predicted sugar kinase